MSNNPITMPQIVSDTQNHVKSLDNTSLLHAALLCTIKEIETGFDYKYRQTNNHDYFVEAGWWSRLFAVLSERTESKLSSNHSVDIQIEKLQKMVQSMEPETLLNEVLFTILDEIIDDCQIVCENAETDENLNEIEWWESIKANLIIKTEAPIGYEPYDTLDTIREITKYSGTGKISSPEPDNARPMSPEVLSSLKKLVDYSWPAESTSFEEYAGDNGIVIETDTEDPSRIPDEMKDHIFYHILVINQWLKVNDP